MSTKPPAAPRGLGARGRRFWRQTLADFELTDAERELLHEACRCLDSLDALADAVAKHGPMTLGAAGQTVVNPALTEARGQRAILHRLVAALALPDPEGVPVPTATTTRAKAAAAARWRGHEKGTA